jgi:hypothetical protein
MGTLVSQTDVQKFSLLLEVDLVQLLLLAGLERGAVDRDWEAEVVGN